MKNVKHTSRLQVPHRSINTHIAQDVIMLKTGTEIKVKDLISGQIRNWWDVS